MKASCMIFLGAVLFFALSSPASAEDAAGKKDIAVKDVPQKVLDAATKAVPGGVVSEAAVETDGKGVKTYELDVKVGDKETEVRVSEDGTVLSTKAEDGKDDDEDDGEDDDEDEDKDDDKEDKK